MNETLSNYFAEHRFDAESQAKLFERSGCTNYEQFLNLIVALSRDSNTEELKTSVNGPDLNSNSVPISAVKSLASLGNLNSNPVSFGCSTATVSISPVVSNKPAVHKTSDKPFSDVPGLKIKPASVILTSPHDKVEKNNLGSTSSLQNVGQLLPPHGGDQPSARNFLTQTLPSSTKSSSFLLPPLSSPVCSSSKTKVELSPNVSSGGLQDFYAPHRRDSGTTFYSQYHPYPRERSDKRVQHLQERSASAAPAPKSAATINIKTSSDHLHRTQSKFGRERDRKLSADLPRDRIESTSAATTKSADIQALQQLQFLQQLDYLQQLQKRSLSPSKQPTTSRCKTEATSAPSSAASMSEHQQRQALMSWAATHLSLPPLSVSGAAMSSTREAAPPPLPPDIKPPKKERHPSSPGEASLNFFKAPNPPATSPEALSH